MSEILRYKMVKTRKPHICFGCGRTFPQSSQMFSAAFADYGTAHSYYLCKTCDKISQERKDWDTEFDFKDFQQEALLFEAEK